MQLGFYIISFVPVGILSFVINDLFNFFSQVNQLIFWICEVILVSQSNEYVVKRFLD